MQGSTSLSLIYTIEGGGHTEASRATPKMRFKSCRNGITTIVVVLQQTVNWDRIFCITGRYTNKGGNESVHNSMERLGASERVFGTLKASLLMGGLPNFISKSWKIQKFQTNLRISNAWGYCKKKRGRTHKV